MVRRLQDGETALDLASLDDWDESGSSTRDDADEIDLDDDDDLPEVAVVMVEMPSEIVSEAVSPGRLA
jgi:hypothetical protein